MRGSRNDPLFPFEGSLHHFSPSSFTTQLLYQNNTHTQVQVCIPLPPWSIRAGARETIYYDPKEVTAAIVTCGGLCPGLNDVVLGLVRKLEDYGVRRKNSGLFGCRVLLRAVFLGGG